MATDKDFGAVGADAPGGGSHTLRKSPAEASDAATARPLADRLSEPQRRHLIELYGDGETTLYWKVTHGSAQHRSALVLARLGLVYEEGSILTHSGGYALTDQGRALAKGLIRDAS